MATIPECLRSMGCLCAGHARGAPASAACDARERTPTKPTKPTQYERSVAATGACRPLVPAQLLPLFDHLIGLAADSHKHGYAKRAGIELRKARKLAKEA